MKTDTTTITHAAIILADVPYIDYHPHQHHGKHFYVVVANSKACAYSPVVQAVPMSSNINRHLPVQVEVFSEAFSKRSYALADQLTLLPREILERGKYCGTLCAEEMKKIQHIIKIQLALD